MRGVLKSTALPTTLRSLSSNCDPSLASTRDRPPIDREQLLLEKIAELQGEIAHIRKSAPVEIKAAREQGRQAGLAERDETATKRQAVLEAGVRKALQNWAAQLEAIERCSVGLAALVLERMIGNPDWKADFVRQSIEHQVARLKRESIVAVNVSPSDFDSEQLAERATAWGGTLHSVDDLSSGECTIDLVMGHRDVGAGAQWEQVSALLAELDEADFRC